MKIHHLLAKKTLFPPPTYYFPSTFLYFSRIHPVSPPVKDLAKDYPSISPANRRR